MSRSTLFRLCVLAALMAPGALAQTSSLGGKQRQSDAQRPPEIPSREQPHTDRNVTYDRYSWVTAKAVPPKTFKVGDLITIIVRETRRFQVKGDLKTKKEFDILSEIDAMFKLVRGGVGAADFQRGSPNVEWSLESELKGKADTKRDDRMTLRLTGKIIDVKPNGLLVLEARAKVQHDDEISVITLTGTCRKEDVTADNTVLSTQIADKNIAIDNQGAVRGATSRGWIPKLLDVLKPF